MKAAMPCKLKTTKSWYLHRGTDSEPNNIPNSKYTFIVKAHESVKSTSPVTENHYKNGYVKLYDDKNLIMTNVDNSDTTCTNKHKNTKYNVRDMYE